MKSIGVSVPLKWAKSVKDHLDGQRCLRKSLKTFKTDSQARVVFPLETQAEEACLDALTTALRERFSAIDAKDLVVDVYEFATSNNRAIVGRSGGEGVQARIVGTLKEVVEKEIGLKMSDSRMEEMPKFNWERHGDLVLLPYDPCFKVSQKHMRESELCANAMVMVCTDDGDNNRTTETIGRRQQ